MKFSVGEISVKVKLLVDIISVLQISEIVKLDFILSASLFTAHKIYVFNMLVICESYSVKKVDLFLEQKI